MTAALRDQRLTVVSAVVYHSYGARLFTAHRPPRISEYAEEKRTEQNLFVRSGKSEAKVTYNRRLHSTYCTANRHEASRGLSAIAELLVYSPLPCVFVWCTGAKLEIPGITACHGLSWRYVHSPQDEYGYSTIPRYSVEPIAVTLLKSPLSLSHYVMC